MLRDHSLKLLVFRVVGYLLASVKHGSRTLEVKRASNSDPAGEKPMQLQAPLGWSACPC